jgi:hypothetical protein
MPDFSLPDRFRDTEHLEDVMTTPAPELVSELGQIDGDIIVLGVGGKIGPTLARLAKRAAPEKRVVGVARGRQAEHPRLAGNLRVLTTAALHAHAAWA